MFRKNIKWKSIKIFNKIYRYTQDIFIRENCKYVFYSKQTNGYFHEFVYYVLLL